MKDGKHSPAISPFYKVVRMPMTRCYLLQRMLVALAIAAFAVVSDLKAAPPQPNEPQAGLFARDNLVAWCIVPFDAKKRGPEERAAMLERLGFKHYAYDWRAEHLPTFEAELESLKRHGVALDAVWFPSGLDQDARFILDVLAKHGVKTQLWVTGGGEPTKSPEEQRHRVQTEAARVRPIAEAAEKIGCTVGLYNHGGWFGEPENQLAILDELKLANVGIVYNLHHGHDHLDRFAALLEKMKPHLLALNLNGMTPEGDRRGQKILPLGQGDLDLGLLRTIRASGYRGPIGILGHTMDDAEQRLADNLDGLDWLVPQLDGKQPGPKPKPRTLVPPSTATASPGGWLAAGRDEYRLPPLTVDCWARLNSKQNYNILVASDTKQSGAHWELFSMAGDGRFTVYMPGMQPDHVRSEVDICDREWHHLAMQFEPGRVRLYCDGKQVADQAITSQGKAIAPGGLAFARLVEGGIGCDGELDWVRLRRGTASVANPTRELPKVGDATLGLWKFEKNNEPAADRSPHKNAAKVASAATPSPAVEPPPGNHLLPFDKRLKAVLIDRSPNDAYCAVKVDGMGRIFVGGREAVFVFEPDDAGGYKPKRELLKFPQDSIIIGLEMRGHDLYVQTSSALYLVPDGVVRREGLELKRLVWGVPLDLHVSFHCLAWGPEGDLYLDHGDPLLNYGDWRRPDHWGYWTLHSQPEGTTTPYTGAGAVLRVRPDGSRLQVVAGGLRGPVGLAFDRGWNLFTNDTDHESRADAYAPARLLHVTPGADFAWPRGWMASKSPDRADLLEPMIATLGRGVPCDLTYYEDPYMADIFDPALLMCRWDRMSVNRYPTSPRGASFSAEELPFIDGEAQIRPVGVTVGRGGRVFVTSLYLGGNVVSPYCASDLVMITRADDRSESPFEAYDITTVDADRLWADLSNRSLERRSRAHQEILRRGGPLLDEAARRFVKIDIEADDPAMQHLPWLAGASRNRAARSRLVELTKHSRPELRQLALRVLAEYRGRLRASELFVPGEADEDPQVQLAALHYFFDSPAAPPLSIIAKLAGGADTYMRQTAARLLAVRAGPAELAELASSGDEATRLGATLAAGLRMTVPPLYEPPPEELPLFYPKANSFFHTELQFADATEPVDLSKLGRIGSYTIAERWKTIPPDDSQLAAFEVLKGALDDDSPAVQSQAAYYLSLLGDAKVEPRLAQVRQSLEKKRLAGAAVREVAQAWRVGPFADGAAEIEQAHPPEQGAIDLTASYQGASGPMAWEGVQGEHGRFATASFPRSKSGGSCYLYFQLQSVRRQPALLTLDSPDAIKAWHNGRPLQALAASGPNSREWLLDLQPGSNDVLLRVHSAQAFAEIKIAVQARGELAAVLPEKLDASLLSERLKSGGGAERIASEFLDVDWPQAAGQGDAAQGRKLFGTLGCVKCHAIAPDQKGGGAPSLVDVRKRFNVPYLVESVLLPSKQVAEPFKAAVIVADDGQIVTGLVVSESEAELELLLADATRKTIAKRQIEERSIAAISPMPAGIVKTPAELRDLLAYLLSENPTPP